jgi:hypothetical protein
MQSHELATALELEKVEFTRSVSAAALEVDKEVKRLQAELAAKGLFQSGARYLRETEIRFAKVAEGPVQRAIEKRRELGRRFPDLLTAMSLGQLRDRLTHHIEIVFDSTKTRLAIGGTARTIGSAGVIQRARQLADQIKGSVTQQLNALTLEARLGIHADPKPAPTLEVRPTTVNISNSTIASLNLGTVWGDLTASVKIMNGQGQEDLADSLEKLAEALVSVTDLQESLRKELVEDVSFIAEQFARLPEERKTGPLKSAIATLGESVKTVSQLVALWTPIEHILKGLGYIS